MDEQALMLAKRFNSMSPEMFQSYINNPATGNQLKAWMKNNNYQHPSMMQSNPVPSPVPSPVSNLGMSGEPNQMIPHPVAPSARVSAGGQMIQPTPTDRAVMPDPQYFIDQHYANDPAYQASMSKSFTGDPAVYSRAENFVPKNVGFGAMSGADPTLLSAEQSAQEAVAKSIAESGAEAGAEAGLWQGPAPALANMALSAIPTRDREKVDTPIGDQGSRSGILKGAGKGALTGATIGSHIAPGVGTAWGASIGGVAGLLGGAQGYFDTTSPPTITQVGLLRGRGGNLSAPKGMYG